MFFYNNTGNIASALYVIDFYGSTPKLALETVALFNVTFDANQPSVKNEEDRQSAITFEKVLLVSMMSKCRIIQLQDWLP